jgi:hypothetical protein
METANEIQEDLRSLAEQMASEPFFKQFDLTSGTLAQINLLIEERESIVDASNPESDETKESYRRFKAAFCLFLMHLESFAPLTDDRMNTVTLGQYLGVAPAESPPEETVMGQIFNFMDHAAKKNEVSWDPETPTPDPPAPKADSPKPTARVAWELYQAAEYLRSLRLGDYPPFPVGQLLRIESQQLCFSIEAELQAIFGERKSLFWSERKPLIASLFVSQKWDFLPALETYLQSLVDKSAHWKKSERLPLLTFKNVLRLADQAEDERFASSSLEQGLWILFFGQDFTDVGMHFTNALKIPQGSNCGEIFLRLCRVNRLKTSLQIASASISNEECTELWDHAQALFSFATSWKQSHNGE